MILVIVAAMLLGAQQQGAPAPAQKPGANRHTVFSRNDEQPQVEAKQPPAGDAVAVSDEERAAVVITSFDLDVRLLPAENALTVRARMQVRNAADRPLARVPLQISSSLTWVAVRVESPAGELTALPLHVATLDSDVDHTGQVKENVVVLPQALAPGASVMMVTLYQGTIPGTARVEGSETPRSSSVRADWDRIEPEFVGLRGFGNVLWHPAASPPLLLGGGPRYSHGVGLWKQRESGAMVHIALTVEYTGEPPDLVLLDGKRAGISEARAAEATDTGGPRVFRAELPATRLGFAAPTIFLCRRQESSRNGVRVFSEPQHAANGEAWQTAAGGLSTLMGQWFGAERKRELMVVELPEPDDAPFSLDNVLFTALPSVPAGSLIPLLADAYTGAYFVSPRVWLAEGVAQFMSLLWTEQVSGRAAALAQMENSRAALALVEPVSAGSAGQPLVSASDEVYYRVKAAYVLWMLRALVGDEAIASALTRYRAQEDTEDTYFERLVENASHQDLGWFFESWVYRDPGLPEISIAAVHSRAVPPASHLVEVELENKGGAAASIAVRVMAGTATTTQQVKLPARGTTVLRFVTAAPPEAIVANDGTVPELGVTTHEQKLP